MLADDVRIVLGSQSPRRRELLSTFVPANRLLVVPPETDDGSEQFEFSDWPPLERQLLRIVRTKAHDVGRQLAAGVFETDSFEHILLCADTVVVVSDTHGGPNRPWPPNTAGRRLWVQTAPAGPISPPDEAADQRDASNPQTPSWSIGPEGGHLRILGKPERSAAGKDELRRWFRRYYCGRDHIVATAVRMELRDTAGQSAGIVESVTRSLVRMTPDVDPWLEWYVRTDEPYDKAGGYAIQGLAGIFVEACIGSLSNVVGLPLRTVLESLRRLGRLNVDPGTEPSDTGTQPGPSGG